MISLQWTDSFTLSTSVTGHTIRLVPLGVIQGKLADQHGDPLGGVSVALFADEIMDGARHARGAGTAVTDDRGQFRIWDLAPGKYFVKAAGRAGGTSMYVGDGAVRYDSWEGFRPVYLGGARDMDSATPVAVAAGSEVRADFTLTVEPVFKIRGAVGNFAANEKVSFKLLEGDPTVADSPVSLDSTTGKFEIDGVPSGQYILRATQGRRARGETAVSVKGGDVNGVPVALAPAVTVTVLERLIGPSPEKPANPKNGGAGEDAAAPEGWCAVTLAPPGPVVENELRSSGPTEGGGMAISEAFAGQYQVRLHCGGQYIVSAVSGNSDLLSNPVLTVQPGVPPPPIEIGMKPGGGQLLGKLAVPGGHQGAGVLLVPAFPASTGPMVSDFFSASESADDPASWFSNLAPGDYLAYAFSDIRSVQYRNPAFLNALAGGTSVRIEDGKTTEIALTGPLK
jgi:uncharacterized protein (DUF2141 family)